MSPGLLGVGVGAGVAVGGPRVGVAVEGTGGFVAVGGAAEVGLTTGPVVGSEVADVSSVGSGVEVGVGVRVGVGATVAVGSSVAVGTGVGVATSVAVGSSATVGVATISTLAGSLPVAALTADPAMISPAAGAAIFAHRGHAPTEPATFESRSPATVHPHR